MPWIQFGTISPFAVWVFWVSFESCDETAYKSAFLGVRSLCRAEPGFDGDDEHWSGDTFRRDRG